MGVGGIVAFITLWVLSDRRLDRRRRRKGKKAPPWLTHREDHIDDTPAPDLLDSDDGDADDD